MFFILKILTLSHSQRASSSVCQRMLTLMLVLPASAPSHEIDFCFYSSKAQNPNLSSHVKFLLQSCCHYYHAAIASVAPSQLVVVFITNQHYKAIITPMVTCFIIVLNLCCLLLTSQDPLSIFLAKHLETMGWPNK